jgi:uncharacterized membrane protein SpoIIM required for sporulation
MILDLPRFLSTERPYWQELDVLLTRLEQDRYRRLPFAEAIRLEYLYSRASSGLARLSTFSADAETRAYLEALVARAYAETTPRQSGSAGLRPWLWLRHTLPETFRRHFMAFLLALGLTIGGVCFGSAALTLDPNARPVLMPFSALIQTPAARIKQEESTHTDRLAGHKSTFSAQLITHNIRVALLTFALGASYGIGSSVLLFYNGVTLGAVAADYIHGGYTSFLLGWLLPHGVIEIPAILVAGQAAFVLASALLGRPGARAIQLKKALPDVTTLAFGAALMLVWAGVVEAFISQYHYPVLPYNLKIVFGLIEFMALSCYFLRVGRRT